MFGIIRIIFWSIAFLICFLIIRKSAIINKRRWYFKSAIIAFVLYTLSGFVPVENALITFSSPEAAFNYTNSDDVILVVEGQESALVIGDAGKKNSFDIIPKSGTGWKLSLAWDANIVLNDIPSDNVIFRVYQYKDSSEYYIEVLNGMGTALDVADNRDSEFCRLKQANNTLDITLNTYYAYVHNLDDEYTLTVDGKTFSVMDEGK